jgi:hypothetical protein
VGFIIRESALKRLGGFRWNPNGFVLIEFGPSRRNHFRLDLGNQGGKGKRIYAGSDYTYEVNSIHLKSFLGTSSDDTLNYWLYYYIRYTDGGVWKWSKDYVKEEDAKTLNFTHMTAPEDDADNGHVQIAYFLEDLGKETNTTQTLAS